MLQINKSSPPPAFALFQLGFRPFFTAAGLFAIIVMALWMLFYDFSLPMPSTGLASITWHAHEMIYGYGMAVVAGFLMTAVGNWTGLITWKNTRLILLVAAWLMARVSLLLPGNQLILAAIFDTLFLSGFLTAISIPVIQTRMWAQMGILSKVLLMLVSNLFFYAGALGYLEQGIHIGLFGGLYMIMSLLFVMLRRVVPFFIERGLNNGFTPLNRKWLDISSIVLFIAWVVLDLFALYPQLLAPISLLLFILHMVRLQGWFTPALFKAPLLWSLYIGYFALSLGFMVKALSIWADLPASLATHTFAVGGIGIMTLAMMSRVILGHTGRDVSNPPKSVTGIFMLIITAAISRTLLPMLDASNYLLWIEISQLFWLMAFVLFCVIYIPQLVSPRIDGRHG